MHTDTRATSGSDNAPVTTTSPGHNQVATSTGQSAQAAAITTCIFHYYTWLILMTYRGMLKFELILCSGSNFKCQSSH